ncbi:hypothetical protein AURDEDRAFT_122805 [Auricularia subglabra TFB-10046 SS5]|nr:hypothetical protein AURDEDRAFT_122805 [Auricularia subglabra TFB-10046 SS5]
MSQHVTPKTLRSLALTRELGVPWLEDFHERHWAKQNGAIVPFEDGGSTRSILCIKNSFDILNPSPLLVRNAYLDLWNYLSEVYLNASPPRRFGTLVYGHPGIGKSLSLFFLMCAAAEHRIPFVFHRAGTQRAFVCLDAGSFFIPAMEIETLDFTAPALILIDSAEHHALTADVYRVPKAHVVVVTSSPAPVLHREFVKQKSACFYTMSLVGSAEFRAILYLRTLSVDTPGTIAPLTAGDTVVTQTEVDLDEDVDVRPPANQSDKFWTPQEVFDICGPNLHWVFLEHDRVTGMPDEILQWTHFNSTTLAARALAGVRSGDPVTAGFRTFFFEQPDPRGPVSTSRPRNTVIPTPFLRGALYAAVREKQYHEQIQMLSQVRGLGAVHDVVFEGVVLTYLATTPHTAVLPPRTPSAISPPHAMVFSIIPQDDPLHPYLVSAVPDEGPFARTTSTQVACAGNALGLTSIEDGLGFCTLPPGFASADALMLAQSVDGATRFEIAFQVTVSKARPIKKRDIEASALANPGGSVQKPSPSSIEVKPRALPAHATWVEVVLANGPSSGTALTRPSHVAAKWQTGYAEGALRYGASWLGSAEPSDLREHLNLLVILLLAHSSVKDASQKRRWDDGVVRSASGNRTTRIGLFEEERVVASSDWVPRSAKRPGTRKSFGSECGNADGPLQVYPPQDLVRFPDVEHFLRAPKLAGLGRWRANIDVFMEIHLRLCHNVATPRQWCYCARRING